MLYVKSETTNPVHGTSTHSQLQAVRGGVEAPAGLLQINVFGWDEMSALCLPVGEVVGGD